MCAKVHSVTAQDRAQVFFALQLYNNPDFHNKVPEVLSDKSLRTEFHSVYDEEIPTLPPSAMSENRVG